LFKVKNSFLFQELKEFLDSAKDGAILMSFGSVVRGDSIAPEKRAAILKAFSKIPQKVLWKWETAGQGDESDVPKNVKLHPWLPQNDILGEFHAVATKTVLA